MSRIVVSIDRENDSVSETRRLLAKLLAHLNGAAKVATFRMQLVMEDYTPRGNFPKGD